MKRNNTIGLPQLKKNEGLRNWVKEKLEEDYLESFGGLDSFCKKYSISRKGATFVINSFNLKKDLSKYSPSKDPEVQEKIKRTKLERYGDENYNNPRKNEKTCLERYGVAHVKQIEDFKRKGKETFEKNYPPGSKEYEELKARRNSKRKETLKTIDYGEKVRQRRKLHAKEDPEFLKNVQKKRKATTLKKYGVDNISALEEIKKKKKDSFFTHYGTTYGLSPEVREKTRNTCLKKFGVESFSQTKEFASKRASRWSVEGKKFDSKWEIYYFYYLKDNNIPFEEQIGIPYTVEGKNHVYICDFKRKDTGELIEIKNPALLNDEGELTLLFRSNLSEKEIVEGQKILEGKMKCIKEHRVKILSDAKYFKNLENLFWRNHPDLKIEKKR